MRAKRGARACRWRCGGLVAATGVAASTFLIFCIGTILIGLYGAYLQSFRFAAADSVSGDMKALAISRVMIGGLAAAIIGPQVVIWTSDAVPGLPYVASFISLSGLALLTLFLVSQLKVPRADKAAAVNLSGGRPLSVIARSPRFILAAGTGVISYALMAFIMTATPLAMVACGHTVGEATLGALQKFCHSFEPPSGWAPACKSVDATHYDGGAYVAPWEFQALYERYAPAQCQHEGALVKRVVQHFARAVSPSICEAVLSGRCPARFCQNTCGGDAPPAPPSHPATVLASKSPCDTGIPDPLPNGSHPVV